MTAKDYKLIASVLRELVALEGLSTPAVVGMFERALQATNPNFDHVKFQRAVFTTHPADRTTGKLAQQFRHLEAHRDHSIHDGFCYTCQVWLS